MGDRNKFFRRAVDKHGWCADNPNCAMLHSITMKGSIMKHAPYQTAQIMQQVTLLRDYAKDHAKNDAQKEAAILDASIAAIRMIVANTEFYTKQI